jgi:hypothetical protein
MLKSVVQMFIIALSKTVRKHNGNAHLILFLLFTLAFFIHSLRFNAFNYARLSMWHRISLGGVYWLAFMNTLDNFTDANMAYIILLFGGWGVCLIIGLVL